MKDERAMGFVTLLLSSKYIHSLDSSLLSSLVVKKTRTRATLLLLFVVRDVVVYVVAESIY